VATPPNVSATELETGATLAAKPATAPVPPITPPRLVTNSTRVWSETFWPMASTTVAVTVDFSPQLTEVGEAATVIEAGGPMTLTVVVTQTSTAFSTATQPWMLATPGVGEPAWTGLQPRIAPARLASGMPLPFRSN